MNKSVYDVRRNVAKLLNGELSNEYVVVAAPDHPLLLRPADVVIGGQGGLTAIVTPTQNELRRPQEFSDRIVLNMMALPPNTNFVFLGSDMPKFSGKLKFAAEISPEERSWKRDLQLVSSQSQTTREVERAEKYQKLSAARFADAYRLARALQRGRKNFDQNSKSGTVRKVKRDLIANEIEGAFFDGIPALQSIAELTFEGARRWYQDLDGEPAPKSAPAGALFSDVVPARPGDPNKVLRAAAFAGWIIAPMASSRAMDEVGELIARHTRLL
ncbi:hypothetical protein [Ruegeria sp. HKCCD6604]|uniref:hypothetical protein n=1 Tax=Ruegeria sp. HKCCD6604 TaxID=2683000 RepID=UPI001492E7A4|nr:hypothetical protein [Ruegeria sp. HKCCD6604]